MKTTSLLCSLLFVFCIFFTACAEEPCTHTYDHACDVACNACGEERTVTHDFAAADCDTPKTCKICGVTDGKALGHTPKADDGDCTTEIKCALCSKVLTPAKQSHDWENGVCSACGSNRVIYLDVRAISGEWIYGVQAFFYDSNENCLGFDSDEYVDGIYIFTDIPDGTERIYFNELMYGKCTAIMTINGGDNLFVLDGNTDDNDNYTGVWSTYTP